MSALLVADNVSKKFGGVVAAENISVRIPAGQTVSLIGTNGAGKTTFVNMVTGYVVPDSGRIMLGDREITGLSPRRVAHLGIARSFQIPQIFAQLTVLENVTIALDIYAGDRSGLLRQAVTAEKRDRVMELLSAYRLEPYADRLAAELPGGARKLLDVALAVASAPQILFLDEPTSGVSSQEKFEVMDLAMAALGRQSVSVMFIEHDMDIVRRYADSVIAFHEGRVLADGPVDDVLNDTLVRSHVIGKLGVKA